MSDYNIEEINEYKYHINDEGYIVLDHYIGLGENVKIPEKINDITVSEVGVEAFANNRRIKNIYLPDSIVIIRKRAFFRCSSIENVRFSKNLKIIESEAFAQCISFKQLLINSLLEYIGEKAFALSGLVTVALLDVLVCKEKSFYLCSNLRSVFIKKCRTISDNVFSHDIRLAHLICEQAITDISQNAFYDCRLFEGINYQEWKVHLTEYKMDEDILKNDKLESSELEKIEIEVLREENIVSEEVSKDKDEQLADEKQFNKSLFEALLKKKSLSSYRQACEILINCELPESMKSMCNELIDRMKVLQESVEKFKEVYQPDMDQFYEYYIPETLQLTAKYIEHLNVGISENALEETRETVVSALNGLITAVNEKADEIYKFASIKIKAEAKALESIMNLDGYVDSEFKIK